jgi:hypothetical protein
MDNMLRTKYLVAAFILLFVAPVRASEQVPFYGTFSGQVTSVTPISPDVLLFEVAVSGIATHLGRFTGDAQIQQNVTNGSYTGTFTWIAANGDTISGTFEGQLIPTSTPGVFENVETIDVNGGTGRFASANGIATAGGQLDQITLSFVFPFEGTISSVGSNHAP